MKSSFRGGSFAAGVFAAGEPLLNLCFEKMHKKNLKYIEFICDTDKKMTVMFVEST